MSSRVKGKIQITLRFNGNFKMLTLNTTTDMPQLFAQVRDTIGDKDANFYLICDGQELEENATGTVSSYDIIHGSFIDFCQRLKGGEDEIYYDAIDFPTLQLVRRRRLLSAKRLRPLPGKISLSREPCCITYDDDPFVDRAKMPCKCVISTETMKLFTEEELTKGRYKFQCPNCGSDWPFYLIRHVLSALMSSTELKTMSSKVNDNYFGNSGKVQKCPSCNNFCERTNPQNNRVQCSVCTIKMDEHYEFCWACLKTWKGSSSRSCGNSGCTGIDARTRYLQECKTKTIGAVSGVPSVRRCAECSQLVNHTDACKHMTCKCGYNFCFVCLKPQIDGKWQCGYYNSICEVAPRQTYSNTSVGHSDHQQETSAVPNVTMELPLVVLSDY